MALGWGKLQEGVVIGVSAGAILSLGTVGVTTIDRYFERRDQVQYLADLIDTYRSRIYGATDAYIEGPQRHVTREQRRKLYYDDMRRTVESVLRERSSRLSYDEVTEVRDVTAFSDVFPSVVLNEGAYDRIFGEFDSMEWLGLR